MNSSGFEIVLLRFQTDLKNYFCVQCLIFARIIMSTKTTEKSLGGKTAKKFAVPTERVVRSAHGVFQVAVDWEISI